MTTITKFVEVCWKWNTAKSKILHRSSTQYSSELRASLWAIDDEIIKVDWAIDVEREKLPEDQREGYDDETFNKLLLDISGRIDILEKKMVIELLKRD